MRAKDFITEIQKLNKNDYTGGKSELKYLEKPRSKNNVAPLPGGSGLEFAIDGNRPGYSTIMILDPNAKSEKPVKDPWEYNSDYKARLKQWEKAGGENQSQVVAKLTVSNSGLPIPNSVSVSTITVDEDYRGIGLAKALYGIVLTIMKKTLVAGGEQTPGGRRNWLSIANIPGVEVKGFVQIEDEELEFASDEEQDDMHDKLMHLGGQFIGKQLFAEYWAFDVIPGKNELKQFKDYGINVLYDNGEAKTGMYAKWVGNE